MTRPRPPDGGLRERLRHETRAAHDALDAALDLIGEPFDVPQLGRLLRRFHTLHQAVEPALAATLEPSLLAGRGKLAALEHDLRLCDAPMPPATDDRPRLPPLSDRAGALGALYVVEGSTLGGRIIARHLRDQGHGPARALRYFEIYGDRTGEMWRTVCAALDEVEDPAEAARCIDAATEMFGALQAWLDPAHWR